MRYLLFLLFALCGALSNAQTKVVFPAGNPNSVPDYRDGIGGDSVLSPPVGNGAPGINMLNYRASKRIGNIYEDTTNSVLYYYNPKTNAWTYTLTSVDISGKLNISDTAAMLLPYLRVNVAAATYTPLTRSISTGYGLTGGGDFSTNRTHIVDSATLSNYYVRRKDSSVAGGYYPFSTNPKSYLVAADISGKLNISDTAAMLSPYLRSNVAAATYQPIGTYVTNVTASLPLASSGGTTPNLTSHKVGSTDSGYAVPNQITGGIGDYENGQGTVISTGSKGFITIPYNCTITNWYVSANLSGTIQFDVKRSGTSIIGAGNKPALSSQQSANAAVSSWTSTIVTAGDILEWVVDSSPAPATITQCTVILKVIK